MANLNWISYETRGLKFDFASGAANTTTKVGETTVTGLTYVYGASISISSEEIGALTGAGVFMIRMDSMQVPIGGLVNFPLDDVFCTCVAIPTARGIVGENRIIFGQIRKGIIVPITRKIGFYFFSNSPGLQIRAIVTLFLEPVIDSNC